MAHNFMAGAEVTSLTSADWLYVMDDGVSDKRIRATNLPISVATQTALDAKADETSGTLITPTLTQPVINVTGDATGDLYFRNGSGAFSRLGIGSVDQLLTVVGGLPAWANAPGGGGGVALGDNPDWTGDHKWTKNSAVSLPSLHVTGTWITGGTSTTNKPHMLIETTGATSNAWSPDGTGLGINAASGFTGNLLDLQLDGVSKFAVRNTGVVTLSVGSDATGDIYYRTSGGVFTRLPIGTNGWVLTVAGGLPSWAAGGGGGITNSAGNNVITKSDGTNLIASQMSDNGTTVTATGGFDFAGHSAMGNASTINTSFWGTNADSMILDCEDDITGSPTGLSKTGAAFFGIRVNFNADGNSTQDIQGLNGSARIHASMTNAWPGFLIGGYFYGSNEGSGAVGAVRGGTMWGRHAGTGTVTNCDAGNFVSYNEGGGIVTSQALILGTLKVSGGSDSTTVYGYRMTLTVDGAGSTVVTSYGFRPGLVVSNSGAITTHADFISRRPTLSTSGTVGTLYGYYGEDLAAITGVTTAWQLYFAGTANQSRIEGSLRVGTLTWGADNLSVGYLEIPQIISSADRTCVITDSGKQIFHPTADTTARTWTIPANASVAFPIGTAITFINENGAGVITIAITTDTMRLVGPGTTGSRTLAANGWATAVKVTSTLWYISGTGLT